MNFATITPTRGDHPEFLEFCKHQLSRMTVNPEKSYFIDYQTESDIVEAVKKGIEMARADGFDAVFIIEDDSAYPADYFERFDIEQHCFWGSYHTTFYNLGQMKVAAFYGTLYTHRYCSNHPDRSSLFNMGFKISALEGFNWPAPGELFLAPSGSRYHYLDMALWEFAISSAKPRQLIAEAGTIGFIHNASEGKGHSLMELCAGKGRPPKPRHADLGLKWFRSATDDEQFDFYSGLIKRHPGIQKLLTKCPVRCGWWEAVYKSWSQLTEEERAVHLKRW